MLIGKRYMTLIPILLLLILVLVIGLRIPVLLMLGDFLVVQDNLHQADIIHVISGLDYRTDYGIQLMKEGYGRQIFFTGPWCSEIQDVHANRGAQRALSQGISPLAIATDSTEIISTYEEATRLKYLINQSSTPVKSVIIVSDPFHMRRALWTYRRVLGKGIDIQMAPVPFERTPFQREWWEDSTSSNMVKEEYLKYIYYLIRYGLNWEPLSNWLATFDRE
jgi:uncharacterized SAM-binding protein YcdF (DUF218 family)